MYHLRCCHTLLVDITAFYHLVVTINVQNVQLNLVLIYAHAYLAY
jgi:hypothetical protein